MNITSTVAKKDAMNNEHYLDSVEIGASIVATDRIQMGVQGCNTYSHSRHRHPSHLAPLQ